MKTRLSAAAVAALCSALLLCSIEAEGKSFLSLLVESDGAEGKTRPLLPECNGFAFIPVSFLCLIPFLSFLFCVLFISESQLCSKSATAVPSLLPLLWCLSGVLSTLCVP